MPEVDGDEVENLRLAFNEQEWKRRLMSFPVGRGWKKENLHNFLFQDGARDDGMLERCHLFLSSSSFLSLFFSFSFLFFIFFFIVASLSI